MKISSEKYSENAVGRKTVSKSEIAAILLIWTTIGACALAMSGGCERELVGGSANIEQAD